MILVTGGAGYIGSHMCRLLRQVGTRHVAFDNLGKGHRAALASTELVLGDVHDSDALATLMRQRAVTAVVHFAASIEVGASVVDPIAYYDNNVGGTLSLIKAMVHSGVDKLVFSSTAAVYGNPSQVPIPEAHAKHPTSPYGHTKWTVETLLEACEWAYGLRSIRLRYFNAAGAWPDGSIGEDHDPETHLIPLVLQTAMGKRESITLFGTDYPTPDGTCVRDYVHVCDLAQAHLQALAGLERGLTGAFNLGTGTGYSVREVVDAARQVTGMPIPIAEGPRREGDPATLVASNGRAMDILGWTPTWSSLEQIVEDAWRWHSQHPGGYGE